MKVKFLSWLAALSFGLLSFQVQAEMITDAHGNVGYDTAAECDAAVHNGSAKFYQPFTRKSPLKQNGEASVKNAKIRDLGEQYTKGACDVGVGHKLGRDGVSAALQGKFVPYSPDMPINAYLNSQGEVVRVSMGLCDNWFSDSIPRPVGDAPQATAVSETPATEPVEVTESPEPAAVSEPAAEPAPVAAKTGVRPYVFGTLGAGRGEMVEDLTNPKNKDSNVKAAGQAGVGLQFNKLLGMEVFYQGGAKRKYKKFDVNNVRNQAGGVRLTLGHTFADKFRLFGKVGTAYVGHSMKTENWRVSEHGIYPTAGVGALYHINDNFALRADYDHHFKQKNHFRNEDYLGLGVQYRF